MAILNRGLSNIHDLIRVINGISRLVRVVQAVRVVKQWFTSRTSGELHIIGETWGDEYTLCLAC